MIEKGAENKWELVIFLFQIGNNDQSVLFFTFQLSFFFSVAHIFCSKTYLWKYAKIDAFSFVVLSE